VNHPAGVDLVNETWRLIESRADNDRLLYAAHVLPLGRDDRYQFERDYETL
jgi:hypothetical protein